MPSARGPDAGPCVRIPAQSGPPPETLIQEVSPRPENLPFYHVPGGGWCRDHPWSDAQTLMCSGRSWVLTENVILHPKHLDSVSCSRPRADVPMQGFRKTLFGKLCNMSHQSRGTLCVLHLVREAPPGSGLSRVGDGRPRPGSGTAVSQQGHRGPASSITDLAKGREGHRIGHAGHTRPKTSKLKGLRTLTEAHRVAGPGATASPPRHPSSPRDLTFCGLQQRPERPVCGQDVPR